MLYLINWPFFGVKLVLLVLLALCWDIFKYKNVYQQSQKSMGGSPIIFLTVRTQINRSKAKNNDIFRYPTIVHGINPTGYAFFHDCGIWISNTSLYRPTSPYQVSLMVVYEYFLVCVMYRVSQYFALLCSSSDQSLPSLFQFYKTHDFVMGGFCCNIKVVAAVFFPTKLEWLMMPQQL